jgi:hypothetical protein
MASPRGNLNVVFPQGFDERWESELPDKGYIEDVVVELASGRRFALSFIDPTRLRQELGLEADAGRPYYAVPNLVVLPEVSRAAIQQVAHELLLDDYFDRLQPLGADDEAPRPHAGFGPSVKRR